MNILSTQLTSFRAEFLARLVAAISGSILTVLLARLLNPDGYGILFLALSILSILKVFSKLGIGKSTGRYIAKYKEQDPSQIPYLLKSSLILNIGTITVVTGFLAVSYELLALWMDEPELELFLSLGVFAVIFGTLITYTRGVLQGFEDIRFAALIRIIERISKFAVVIGLIWLGYGAIGAFIGYIIGYMIASIIGLLVIYIFYYRNYPPAPSIESGLFQRLAEYSIPITLTESFNKVDKEMDTVLVGVFLNPAAVSFYVLGKQVVEFIQMPVAALGFTLSPTFGAQKASGNTAKAAQSYESAVYNTLLLYIPAAAGLAILAEPMIGIVFGESYLDAVPVLQIFAIYALLQAISTLTSNTLDYLGRARERAIARGITSILNLVLNILLIPIFGVVGAAVATIFTYTLFTVANLYIIHTEFRLRILYLLKMVGNIVIVTSIMSIIVLYASQMIIGPASLIGVVILGLLVWGGISLATGLLDVEELKSIT